KCCASLNSLDVCSQRRRLHMGFIMDGLDAETYDRKYDDRQLISRIIGYFRPQLSLMLFVAVLVVLTSLMDTAFPLLIALTLNLLSQLLLFVLIAAVLFYINYRLALLALTITPVIVAIALAFRWIARRTTRRSQRSLARVNANVQEAISGITVAKNFRQEQNMYDTFKKVNVQSYHVNVRSGFVYNGVFPLLFLVANIGTTIVVYFGGLNVLSGGISAGEWFLFVQSIGILWFPLTSIASFWSQFQLGLS